MCKLCDAAHPVPTRAPADAGGASSRPAPSALPAGIGAAGRRTLIKGGMSCRWTRPSETMPRPMS